MKTYLPSLYGNRNNDRVAEFEAAWLWERVGEVTRDERLMAVAQKHAEYLAQRQVQESMQSPSGIRASLHLGEGGSSPNERVRAGGYDLGDMPIVGNNVESCSSNWHSGPDAVAALLRSPSHRMHLLGENGFDSLTVYGIGNAHDFWVILICPPE